MRKCEHKKEAKSGTFVTIKKSYPKIPEPLKRTNWEHRTKSETNRKKRMGFQRMYNERSLENLISLADRSPEERREIARMGGLTSGERKRYRAQLRLAMIEHLAALDLAQETREEYRRAIRRYVREERKKAEKWATREIL